MRIAVALGLVLLCLGRDALAYRPFDGTDAAVADPGEIELEMGAGAERQGPVRALAAPAAVFNYGVAEGWEAVLQSQVDTVLHPHSSRSSLGGNGLLLKGVLRDGALQDRPGPSIASELGALLPGIGADSGAGASWAGILSWRWDRLTAHFNAQASLTRDGHADFFVGTILEGPRDWPVRPVGEVFWEREPGAFETVSGLVGAIWQPRENLAVDFGLREASISGHSVNEMRAGVTIGLPLK